MKTQSNARVPKSMSEVYELIAQLMHSMWLILRPILVLSSHLRLR
jgi:hypothetical protein